MSARANKILLLASCRQSAERLLVQSCQSHEIVTADNPVQALELLSQHQFDGVFVTSDYLEQVLQVARLLQHEQVLENMPDGVVLLDADCTIIWSNGKLCEWTGQQCVVGKQFYQALNSPQTVAPDLCPFRTALATGRSTSSTLRSNENRYYRVHAAPLRDREAPPQHLVVTVRDVTEEVHQQQKLAAIHQAGMQLADLTPEELSQMPVKDRIELLKQNILHFTKDLLNFDVVEIRLVDPATGRLEPLLSSGMDAEAAARVLYVSPQGNGVTGFVAATGQSYLCEDTTRDPLYLKGVEGAKSSMTVPLLWRDQVIGTFNVESPEPRAFGESDRQFLEIFSREVAAALNTLELLTAEKASTAQQSVEAIHSAVALPVDEILNDAVNVMERYSGQEPEVVERLQRIVRNARDIKQVIQQVGQTMAPVPARPQDEQIEERRVLCGRRILVVDADECVRSTAHVLLERYGCIVETAHGGNEAIGMVRATLDGAYDVIISDIRLPDMTGYELMLKLQELVDAPPLVLMTGFGYDSTHTIVNARKAGLPAWAVLYKPFRLDQLLTAVKRMVCEPGPVGRP
jgi:PAS domain S-box-containing protein